MGDPSTQYPKVFISYCQENKEFSDVVLEFSNKLRHEGIDTILDQYLHSPSEGWPRWRVSNIGRADFVIMICTEEYNSMVERGVIWESSLIYQHLYNGDSLNTRFIPIVFREEDRKYIPIPIQGATNYNVNKEEEYEALYWRLRGVNFKEEPSLGKLRPLPPKERRSLLRSRLEDIVEHIEEGLVTPEEIYDYFRQDSGEFEEIEDLESNPACVSTKNVLIHCNLPEFPEIHGSILIAFRNLRIRDCYITLSHAEIVKNLFQGIGSSPESKFRGFIVACNEAKNLCIIQLGNNRFTITIEETRQLCELVDKVAPKYIDAVKSIEVAFKSQIFSYSSKGRFRLLKISRALWRAILDFAKEHDYENGDTDWHIFDGKAVYLKIYCSTPQDRVRNYRLFIYPEAEDYELWESFAYPDNEVWLCWEPKILINNKEDITKLQQNVVWNAEYSYHWLKNCLIPVVIEYYKLRERAPIVNVFKRKKYLMSPFDKSIDITYEETTALKIIDIKEIDKLKSWVESAQYFFAVHLRHFLSVESLKGVYNGILICFKHFELNKETLGYVNIKLEGKHSLESIRESVQQKLVELDDEIGVSSRTVEYALRSLCAVLREGRLVVDEVMMIQEIAPYLEMLREEYDLIYDLERARNL